MKFLTNHVVGPQFFPRGTIRCEVIRLIVLVQTDCLQHIQVIADRVRCVTGPAASRFPGRPDLVLAIGDIREVPGCRLVAIPIGRIAEVILVATRPVREAIAGHEAVIPVVDDRDRRNRDHLGGKVDVVEILVAVVIGNRDRTAEICLRLRLDPEHDCGRLPSRDRGTVRQRYYFDT